MRAEQVLSELSASRKELTLLETAEIDPIGAMT